MRYEDFVDDISIDSPRTMKQIKQKNQATPKKLRYRRLSNFTCFEFHPNNGGIVIFVKFDPKKVLLEEGFSHDVSNIGHYGTGDWN